MHIIKPALWRLISLMVNHGIYGDRSYLHAISGGQVAMHELVLRQISHSLGHLHAQPKQLAYRDLENSFCE